MSAVTHNRFWSLLLHSLHKLQATSGICYRTLQYADSQVNKLEITPDKHYLAGAAARAPVPLSDPSADPPALRLASGAATRAAGDECSRACSGGQSVDPAFRGEHKQPAADHVFRRS